jgi:hypothetical protein
LGPLLAQPRLLRFCCPLLNAPEATNLLVVRDEAPTMLWSRLLLELPLWNPRERAEKGLRIRKPDSAQAMLLRDGCRGPDMCPTHTLWRMAQAQELIKTWPVSSHVQSRLGELVAA